MSMTWEKFQEIGDAAHVNMSVHGRNALTGGQVDRLPPRLWEDLRVRLQDIYREATGEEFAVVVVKGGDE